MQVSDAALCNLSQSYLGAGNSYWTPWQTNKCTTGVLEHSHKDQFQEKDGQALQVTSKTEWNHPVKDNSAQEFKRCL